MLIQTIRGKSVLIPHRLPLAGTHLPSIPVAYSLLPSAEASAARASFQRTLLVMIMVPFLEGRLSTDGKVRIKVKLGQSPRRFDMPVSVHTCACKNITLLAKVFSRDPV